MGGGPLVGGMSHWVAQPAVDKSIVEFQGPTGVDLPLRCRSGGQCRLGKHLAKARSTDSSEQAFAPGDADSADPTG